MESAVGAWLINSAKGSPISVHYWSSSANEVDFVLARGAKLVAIEVKSAQPSRRPAGMAAFAEEFRVHRKLLVGGDGIPVEEFLRTDLATWFA